MRKVNWPNTLLIGFCASAWTLFLMAFFTCIGMSAGGLH